VKVHQLQQIKQLKVKLKIEELKCCYKNNLLQNFLENASIYRGVFFIFIK
jgi:hypothetical protein